MNVEELNMTLMPLILKRVCLGLLAVLSLGAMAQNYPAKPIKVVVGYAAGGAVDIIARTVGQSMATSMGQPFVIENRPGAGSNIAVKSVIAADPDGYTLMLAANALAANMSLYQPPPFDADKDLVAISLVGRVPVVIAAHPQVPYANVRQLIEAAKGKPNAIAYGSPGNGSTPHMAIELFARAAGIDLQHIPYKGGSPAITDTIGAQLPLVAVNAPEALPHVRSGKLKLLAVLSANRSANYPDVPTIAESGFPGFEASVWYGLVAPSGTPKAVIAKLHEEAQKALTTREVRERMTAVGGEVAPGSSDMFAQLIRSEAQRYSRLVRAANIQPD
jgi:tripartite-type tricarboxylate transporter receptor subunit TctC